MAPLDSVDFCIKKMPELQTANVFMKNPDEVENKIKVLIAGGLRELQVVSDFDQTLTKQTTKCGTRPVTSFGLLQMCPSIPDNYRVQTKAMYEKYRPCEMDETLTRAEKTKLMLEWWHGENELLKNWSLPKHEFLEVAKIAEVPLRDGALEMLNYLNAQNVPVLIFSAGMGDSIMAVLEINKLILPNLKVVSNFLKYKDGSILDGMKEPLIHILNKNEQALHDTEYYDLVQERGNVLLMGDTIGDAGMADGVPHCNVVLRIGFVCEKAEELIKPFSDHFDIVLVNDQTMNVANAIIKLISQ